MTLPQRQAAIERAEELLLAGRRLLLDVYLAEGEAIDPTAETALAKALALLNQTGVLLWEVGHPAQPKHAP